MIDLLLAGRVISSIDDSLKQLFSKLDTPVNNTNSSNILIRLFCLKKVPRAFRFPLGTTHNGVTIFRNNTLIKKFNEFKYFSVVEIYGNWNAGDYHSFRGCSNLEAIEFPDTLTKIGQAAFYNCTKLTHVDFKNVTNVNRAAFQGTNIDGAVFNEGFTVLGLTGTSYAAFSAVRTLKYVDLPSTTTAIGGDNFRYSPPVLVCRATQPPSLEIHNTAPTAIYVPAASVDAYKAATNWSAQASKIRQIEGTWYETHRELEPTS